MPQKNRFDDVEWFETNKLLNKIVSLILWNVEL